MGQLSSVIGQLFFMHIVERIPHHFQGSNPLNFKNHVKSLSPCFLPPDQRCESKTEGKPARPNEQ